MKKLIGILCCMAALVMSFAAQAKSFDIERNLEILQMLGIDEDVSMSTLNTDKEVTRADFVYNTAALIGAGSETSTMVYYHDVSKDYWAFNAISALTSRGIISGGENSMFRPEDAITRMEAVKILTSIMGYGQYAESQGGYPNGYMAAASTAGLFDGCSSSETLTVGDMYTMLVNALTGPTMVVEYSGAGNTYRIDEDTTILSVYHNMYLESGTLTGADTIDILNSDVIPEGRAVIENAEYISGSIDAVDFLGSEVDFIYRTNEYDERELMWLSGRGTNQTLELDDTYSCSYDENGNVLTYTGSDGNQKRAKLDPGFVMVYNGSATSDNVSEILNSERYTLKLISTAGSGSYDLAIVWRYENYFVGSIDKDKGIIYDKTDWSSVSLSESDYDSCVIKVGGSVSTLDSITEDMVVSVYKSNDGRRVLAEASAVTANGVIDSISDSKGDEIITISGSEYIVYDSSKDLGCSAGDNVTLYLDINGYVAGVKKAKGSGDFGYIIKTYEGDLPGEEFYIRLMDSEGTIDDYKCSDKIVVDGQKMDVEDLNIKFVSGGKTVQQLVWFRTNSDGQLVNIDTPYLGEGESADTSLREYQSSSSIMYKNNGKMGTKIYVNDSTKIFAVPNTDEEASNEDYMVKSRSNLVNDTSYMTSAYRMGSDLLEYEEVLVIHGTNWTAASNTDPLMLVSDIQQGLNDNGEVVEVIHGFKGSEEVWLTCDASFSCDLSGIDAGDTIRVEYSRSGDVIKTTKYYDYSERKGTSIDASSLNAGFRAGAVFANDRVGDMILCGYSDGSEFDEVFNLGGVTILVYDSEVNGGTARTGSLGDIKTYQMTRSTDECSTMVIHTNWMYPVTVVIYN
ncbi:MAG TPA: S-layer homology domain-containing protein [Candidatus Ornithomonoglobus intestinigallinarum]|uniref:S-layer homology domain-containing protein n=1 Tax=Candidatus Ornithomonoglobus intestinigallinarum TaxID=2840894 RepID=A0A9D1H4N6_9FIRM|nr:S-layer homology domain-containing protein [Candidatus Ornithomonoglobus intestinigallinarum]